MPKTPNYDQARKAFRTNGYVSLPGFLSPDEIEDVRQHIHQFIDERVPAMPGDLVFYEDKQDKSSLKQIQNMFKFDPYFNAMMMESGFAHLAKELLEDEIVGWNVQYFNKPPGIGQPTPAHQDGFYFMLEPCEALTMWLALEQVNEENGCVRYVKGSHLAGMRPHGRTQTLGFSQGITDFGTPDDRRNEVAFPAEAGHLLAHHALTIHRADGNHSRTRTRQALGLIYFAAGARKDHAAHEAYQKNLRKELHEVGKL